MKKFGEKTHEPWLIKVNLFLNTVRSLLETEDREQER